MPPSSPTSITSIRSLFQRKSPDAERQKTALHSLEGSIKAVMNALSERGVSDDGLLEFECLMDVGEYKEALEVSTRYLHYAFVDDEDLIQLLIYAWQALCNYHGRIFQQVCRECLRREGCPPPTKQQRRRRNELGEVATSCMVGLIKMQKTQERLERYNKWKRRQEERQVHEEVEDNITAIDGDVDDERDEMEQQDVSTRD